MFLSRILHIYKRHIVISLCLTPSSHLSGFRNIVFAQDGRLSSLQIIEQDRSKILFMFGQMAKPLSLQIVVQDYSCVVLPTGWTDHFFGTSVKKNFVLLGQKINFGLKRFKLITLMSCYQVDRPFRRLE